MKSDKHTKIAAELASLLKDNALDLLKAHRP